MNHQGPAALLPQVVAGHAGEHGERVFVQEVGGGAQTYAETHDRATRWAMAFRSLGVKAGDRVSRFTPTCVESVNIWIGLGWLRATDVPVNTEFRGSILAATLENAQAELLVCHVRWIPAVLDVADRLSRLKTIITVGGPFEPPPAATLTFVDGQALVDGVDEIEPLDGPRPHDLAMVVYTSGTVGVAKAAMLTWQMYANGADHVSPPDDLLTKDDALYLPYPLFHIAGTFWTHGIARAGARVVLRETFSTSSFWREIREYGCTVTHFLGATANFVYRQEPAPDDADNPLRIASMVPLLKNLEDFERRFGLRAYSVYGMTELGVVSRTELSPRDPAACGRPFPEFELRIVDALDREVPVGQVGELVVRPTVPWTTFTGYFGAPEATVRAWRNLWFHTGDGFRRDADGEYYFVDRVRDSIRRRGENISSTEVEAYVLRYEPVLECAAIPAPSEWSEDEVKVCVVAKPGQAVDPRGLLDFLVGEQMPRFMLPRFVEVLAEMPKTPTGKIQKHTLRANTDTRRDWDRDVEMPTLSRPGARRPPSR
ncbi:AMP-binding protein [Phytohabitans sp. ZYX-F-186]|uniref:AMP-binding protein n=1 Tax=Phytohabitans maris TaxID=3071409 RepID=A0ABU0ZV13_9ACTN|nr:AMP-binding protein [Phytohabitans sp. ZYX-F-186]MDQ7910827.1 AMP-binding protein [Phytohabitans sp. ZYX-F-186]